MCDEYFSAKGSVLCKDTERSFKAAHFSRSALPRRMWRKSVQMCAPVHARLSVRCALVPCCCRARRARERLVCGITRDGADVHQASFLGSKSGLRCHCGAADEDKSAGSAPLPLNPGIRCIVYRQLKVRSHLSKLSIISRNYILRKPSFCL